jgi:hypothetical protein
MALIRFGEYALKARIYNAMAIGIHLISLALVPLKLLVFQGLFSVLCPAGWHCRPRPPLSKNDFDHKIMENG